MNIARRKLVNFRVPEDVIEMFDRSCEFRNQNRTQGLIDLMRKNVEETYAEIDRWKTVYESSSQRQSERF